MRRARRRFRSPGWLLWPALAALAVYLLRLRARRLFAALSRALTDRALRALAETFREEAKSSEEEDGRRTARSAARRGSPA